MDTPAHRFAAYHGAMAYADIHGMDDPGGHLDIAVQDIPYDSGYLVTVSVNGMPVSAETFGVTLNDGFGNGHVEWLSEHMA